MEKKWGKLSDVMAKPKLGHFWMLFFYPVLGLFLLGNFFLSVWQNLIAPKVIKPDFGIITPLPHYLKPGQVLAANLWLPDERRVLKTTVPQPDIKAESYIAIDLSTNQILLEKNSRKRLPVASTLKIITALVALERGNLDQKITTLEYAASVGEDSMGLSAGEKLTLEELLYGLLLPSGNDAAEAIAEGIAGRRGVFINWMNSKVYELGLANSFFINPSGLEEEDKGEFSTAYDLMVVTYHALRYPKFREIVKTSDYVIPYSENHKAFYLWTQTNFLAQNPEIMGVKMGYTPSAGLCGVTLAQSHGREILGVLLNTPSRRDDIKNLLNYSFQAVGVSPPID